MQTNSESLLIFQYIYLHIYSTVALYECLQLIDLKYHCIQVVLLTVIDNKIKDFNVY